MNTLVTANSLRGLSQSSSNGMEMSDRTFENIRRFIYENTGIYFQDNKKYLLESRLLKRINFLNLDSYEEYLDMIKTSLLFNSEKRYLFDAITINETFFFRNQPQLDVLINTILPEVINNKALSNGRKIRIWSAASSSGEEAYSVAISIVELLKPKYPSLDFEIVGTDISASVIDTAKKAVYKEYSVRNTPAFYLKKYFKQINENTFVLDPKIRDMVSFKVMNLYDEAAMKTMINFDVIFCANVLIYFNQDSKIKVVSRLYNSLNRNGYLFIGYSETLHNISKAFQIVSFPKTIAYKKE